MAILLGQPINWQHPINRGLVSWYYGIGNPWNAGTQWRDICRRNDGTLTGNAVFARGHVQGTQGLLLDGTGDYLSIATSTSLDIGNVDFTISCWFWTAAFTSYMTLFDHGIGSVRDYALFINTVDTGYIASGHEVGAVASYSPVWTTNEWNYCTVVRSGTTMYTYRNAVLNSTTTGHGSSPESGSPIFRIGGNPSGGGTEWGGYIADFRIYNRALSDSEIAKLYTESITGYPTALNRIESGFPTTLVGSGIFPISLILSNIKGFFKNMSGWFQN